MATAKKAPVAAGAKPAAPVKKRTPNPAFMKALTPSPALAAVVGAAPLPRTEIISKLWIYIKAHNLQDPANKRMINADAKLKDVFEKPQVSMFEMAGLIGKHVK
ncbi:MAG: SWIB/MDM2 domain-containing protein [Giesbergeria sp.]